MTALSLKTPLLRVEQLSLAAAGRGLIGDLNFQVLPGERWVVIGRNAAGKSTLLRALANLPVPEQTGRVIWPAAQLSSQRAYLPQQSNDRFDLTVQEFLQLHAAHAAHAEHGADTGAAPNTSLDIAHLLQRPITQLSGGERQRVGLAAVAQQRVPMWLLDEPVSFQDPAHQQQVGAWLCAQSQVGMVMTAHDMNWVSQVATHVIAVLPSSGRVLTGSRQEVLNGESLAQTFGCEWVCLQGRWLPADL